MRVGRRASISVVLRRLHVSAGRRRLQVDDLEALPAHRLAEAALVAARHFGHFEARGPLRRPEPVVRLCPDAERRARAAQGKAIARLRELLRAQLRRGRARGRFEVRLDDERRTSPAAASGAQRTRGQVGVLLGGGYFEVEHRLRRVRRVRAAAGHRVVAVRERLLYVEDLEGFVLLDGWRALRQTGPAVTGGALVGRVVQVTVNERLLSICSIDWFALHFASVPLTGEASKGANQVKSKSWIKRYQWSNDMAQESQGGPAQRSAHNKLNKGRVPVIICLIH